jgi:hypothetical protein
MFVGIPAAWSHFGTGMQRAVALIRNGEHKRSFLVTWARYGEPGKAQWLSPARLS